MTYESWRISYQSSEAAARSAWQEMIRLHHRVNELEAQLSAIGAGGVEPLRKQAAAPQAVQAAEPVDMRLVPAEFVRGFCTLAHNYSLPAEAPDYYHGVERDAFRAAYERCGRDLAKLRELLATTPAHPAEGVPVQVVELEVDDLIDRFLNAQQDLNLAANVHMDQSIASASTLLDEVEIALRALAATQPAAQGLEQAIKWPKARDVGRFGDMSPDAFIRVGLDADNDVYVSICDGNSVSDIEFCTPGGGGGRSSRTRMALIALMCAIEADNASHPSFDFWQRNIAAQAKQGG